MMRPSGRSSETVHPHTPALAARTFCDVARVAVWDGSGFAAKGPSARAGIPFGCRALAVCTSSALAKPDPRAHGRPGVLWSRPVRRRPGVLWLRPVRRGRSGRLRSAGFRGGRGGVDGAHAELPPHGGPMQQELRAGA